MQIKLQLHHRLSYSILLNTFVYNKAYNAFQLFSLLQLVILTSESIRINDLCHFGGAVFSKKGHSRVTSQTLVITDILFEKLVPMAGQIELSIAYFSSDVISIIFCSCLCHHKS